MYTCPACGWRGDDHEATWRLDGVETTWASSYCPTCGRLIDSEDDEYEGGALMREIDRQAVADEDSHDPTTDQRLMCGE